MNEFVSNGTWSWHWTFSIIKKTPQLPWQCQTYFVIVENSELSFFKTLGLIRYFFTTHTSLNQCALKQDATDKRSYWMSLTELCLESYSACIWMISWNPPPPTTTTKPPKKHTYIHLIVQPTVTRKSYSLTLTENLLNGLGMGRPLGLTHVMLGVGDPSAWHFKSTLSPCATFSIWDVLDWMTVGGSEIWLIDWVGIWVGICVI